MNKTITKTCIILSAILLITCILLFILQKPGKTENTTSINNINNHGTDKDNINNTAINNSKDKTKNETVSNIINTSGNTLQTRINPPEGYKRTNAKKGSLTEFLRNYKMKKDGKPVLLYDKSQKSNQSAHAAIFKLPIENEDLQQCADSVMRVYAEYFWHTDQKDRIKFHFVDGFLAEYSKWRSGSRIQISGNNTYWVNSAQEDNSYQTFKKYMRMVFAYSGTLSMEAESKKINLKQLRIGDIFINGGSPGHVVMVVDLCKDKNGNKAFLLAQGYMPAQEFHVLKNPAHNDDPWYYEKEVTYPFNTPEYTFNKGSLKRLKY